MVCHMLAKTEHGSVTPLSPVNGVSRQTLYR